MTRRGILTFIPLLFLFLLGMPRSIHAQTLGYYRDISLSWSGVNLIPNAGAQVTVCAYTATTDPCTPTVPIYADSAGLAPKTNPITTGPDGSWSLYATPGEYSYTVTGTGLNPQGPFIFNVPTFSSSAINPSAVNNIITVNGVAPYTYTTAGLQAAVAQGIANYNAGTGPCEIDMRSVPSGLVLSSELDVGNSAFVPCTLLVSNGIGWGCSISNGTSYCLKIFDKSAVISWNSGGEGNPFAITLTSGANVAAICGNDPSSNYIHMEGISCGIYNATATVGQAMLYFQNLQDSSTVERVVAFDYSSTSTVSKLFWDQDSCCSITYRNVVADAGYTAGVTPCTFQGLTSNSEFGVIFDTGSCLHPGTGLSNVSVTGSVYGLHLRNIYMETNPSDTSYPPCILFAGNVSGSNTVEGGICSDEASNSANYGIERGSGAGVNNIRVYGFSRGFSAGDLHHGIKDDATGLSQNANVNTGAVSDYDTVSGPIGTGANLQTADITAATLIPASGTLGGHYLVGCYLVVEQAASASSTLSTCSVSYNDYQTNVGVGTTVVSTTNTGNVVGSTHQGGTVDIQVAAGAPITYTTTGYASSGATPMEFSVQVTARYMGP